MKQNVFNIEGIDLNAQCVGGQTLSEYLNGKSLEEHLQDMAENFSNAIEEGIADSLGYDYHYAPELYKAEMQNIETLIPDKETRDYILSII